MGRVGTVYADIELGDVQFQTQRRKALEIFREGRQSAGIVEGEIDVHLETDAV